MPARLKLIVAYDGTPYSGWQSQPNGNGIQDHLETAFAKICSQPIRVHGAGRTDAGVHALGQCAHADLPMRRYGCERWLAALNGILPPTIRILRCRFVGESFHARFSAKTKTYRYRIWNSDILLPLENARSWHVRAQLDRSALSAAAQHFLGRHDFASFAANRGKKGEETVRTIHKIRIRYSGPLISMDFEGDGFLYKMVRMVVAALVSAGSGKSSDEEIRWRLARPDKSLAHPRSAAPASGLFLIRVRY